MNFLSCIKAQKLFEGKKCEDVVGLIRMTFVLIIIISILEMLHGASILRVKGPSTYWITLR